MKNLLLAAMVVVGLVTAAPPPAPPPEPPPHPCATATEICDGTVEVPLNWDDPDSERIGVTFRLAPRRDLSQPAAGTILAHLGGPNRSIDTPEHLRAALLEHLGPVYDRHDVVIADLRGLGRSSPLGCTGVDVDRPETVAGCADQLGPRAAWFTLDQAVHDYEAVRAALGVPRWTLFGNSWGTELAQAYASRYPERKAAVFLNGAVPARPDGYLSAGGSYEINRTMIETLGRTCEATPECAALPGSTGERLAAVVTAFRAAGADVSRLVAVLQEASFVPTVGRDLDAALQAHLEGDPAPLQRLTDAAPPPFDRPELSPDRAIALLAYQCGPVEFPFDRTGSVERRRAQLDAFYAEQQPFAPFTREEVAAGSFAPTTAEMCLHWPWLRESPPVDVSARVDVPVLQVAGANDPTTADAEEFERLFPRQTLIRVPGGDHQNWDDEHPVDGWCVRDTMRAFLLDPAAPVVGGCDRATFHPLGGFPRTAADLPSLDAVARATVVDATMPRHPSDPPARPEFTRPGVRGGTATGTADGRVVLTGYRFVSDVAVDGTITITPDWTATADLTLTAPDGVHRIQLTWPLLTP